MAGYVVIRITERLGGGEPLRTAYAVVEANEHRAIALFKLRPDHTADEQVEVVAELTQSSLDALGLKPRMIKPYDREGETPSNKTLRANDRETSESEEFSLGAQD
jgi:hypothetical protein